MTSLIFQQLPKWYFWCHLLFQNLTTFPSRSGITFSLPWNQTGLWMVLTNRKQKKVTLHDFQGWLTKGGMVSTQASCFGILTLGTQSPCGEEAQTICRSIRRHPSWEPQLRAQPIGNVTCELSDNSSPGLWAILDDAESSRDKLSLPSLSPFEIYEQITVLGWCFIQQ